MLTKVCSLFSCRKKRKKKRKKSFEDLSRAVPCSCPLLSSALCVLLPLSSRGSQGGVGAPPPQVLQEAVFAPTAWGTCRFPSFVSCLRDHCPGYKLNTLLFIYFDFFSFSSTLRQERVSDLCYANLARVTNAVLNYISV